MTTQPKPQIRVKSYFANSVPEAIELARTEMGPDVFLLDSRRAPPEARHLGPLEVTFGESIPAPAALPAPAAEPAPTGTPSLEDLSRRMNEICDLLARHGMNGLPSQAGPRPAAHAVIDAGISPELSSRIDEAVGTRLANATVADISRANAQRTGGPAELIDETACERTQHPAIAPTIGRITALVGPPGSGKTTTLVKLAVHEGLMKARPVKLISADWQRIAAAEQLKIYAAILGVPFQSVDSVSALIQAIDGSPSNALLLIDTPGLSPASMDKGVTGLADELRRRQDIDSHLVLTATMRSADLAAAIRRFSAFEPAALIFTHLDETDSVSSAFSEAVRSGTPVSFLCNGQLVPEDIEPANAHFIGESLVRNLPLQVVRHAA